MSAPVIIILATIVVVFVAFVLFSVWAWKNRESCPDCGCQELKLLTWHCKECWKLTPNTEPIWDGTCCHCGSRYMTTRLWECDQCGNHFYDSHLSLKEILETTPKDMVRSLKR